MAQYNARFAVAPQTTVDAHRTLLHNPDELALILCLHHTRKLSKNLTFQFHNREYQIQTEGQGYRLRRAAVTVCEAFEGSVSVIHQGKPLAYRLLAEGEPPTPLDDEKSVHHRVERAKARQAEQPRYKPALDHPWRRRTISDTSSAAT